MLSNESMLSVDEGVEPLKAVEVKKIQTREIKII